jgi:tetratricopeptide (TPR) repeat protein
MNEAEQLKQITGEYIKGMQIFAKRDYEIAFKALGEITEKYKDSEFVSVAEIRTRITVYKNICYFQLNPEKTKIETDEDYLNEGVFSLNAGNYDRAIELFTELENRKYKDFYLNYLFSLAYLKKNDVETSLKYLKKCIKQDSFFKIIAYNEPDFGVLFDDETFRSLVE